MRFSTIKTGKALEIALHPLLQSRIEELYKNRADEIYVFPQMASLHHRSKGSLSVKFTALLSALGINSEADQSQNKGARKTQAKKSFHSIRNTVITMLRSTNVIPIDIARAIVGHDSEKVERQYFKPSAKDKQAGFDYLASQIE